MTAQPPKPTDSSPQTQLHSTAPLQPLGPRPLAWWRHALAHSAEPLHDRLSLLYGTDQAQLADRRTALKTLLDGFEHRYGDWGLIAIARAPGRLNTLGRHIDHRGGYVNPVALQYEALLAFRPRDDDRVHADDLAPQFPPRAFAIADLRPDKPIADLPAWLAWTQLLSDRRAADNTRTDWIHKLAAPAAYLQHMHRPNVPLRGYDGLLFSSVPRAIGLSSSSTIVVLSLEALLAVNNLHLPDDQYPLHCGVAEWYVGTRGGCGDHAAIKFARPHHIIHMRTEPHLLIRNYLPFPPGYQLLIFDAGIVADKTGPAGQKFNEKTATYAIGELYVRRWLRHHHPHLHAQLTTQRADRPPDRQIYLGDLVEHLDHPALFDLLQELPLRQTRHELRRHWPDQTNLLESYFATHREPQSYPIRDVILFGLSECARSARLAAVLQAGDVATYGRYMNLSHDADRATNIDPNTAARKHDLDPTTALHEHSGDYDCSLEPIDQMVDVALAAGALGAQVCGAGLGGSVMALVPDDQAQPLIEQMTRRYYLPTARQPCVLPVRPSAGAGLL